MDKMMEKQERSSSSASAYTTPPPKVAAPSPAKPPKKPTPKALVAPPSEVPPPTTEAARMQRLRRLCERKPSGKCSVPQEIHLKWKNGTREDRETLMEELERAGWAKETL